MDNLVFNKYKYYEWLRDNEEIALKSGKNMQDLVNFGEKLHNKPVILSKNKDNEPIYACQNYQVYLVWCEER